MTDVDGSRKGGSGDRRKLVRTGTPGIFRRQSANGSLGQYVAIYRVDGKQRRRYVSTLEQARRFKREREAERERPDGLVAPEDWLAAPLDDLARLACSDAEAMEREIDAMTAEQLRRLVWRSVWARAWSWPRAAVESIRADDEGPS